MNRRIMTGLSTLMVAGVLAGCGGAGDASTNTEAEKLNIGLFGPRSNNYFKAYEAAAKKWAKANGAEITVHDPGFDQQKQFTQIQDAIAQRKLDGMAIAPLNGPALAPLVKQAAEAGIKSVAVDSPLHTDHTSTDPKVAGLDGVALTPADKRGGLLADSVVDACKGIDPCQAIYEAVLMNQPAEKAIYDAFEEELGRHSNIKLLPFRDKCMAQRDPAVGVTQDLLQVYPDIDVIASADQCLIGAEVALDQAGKAFGTQPGQVRLCGGGGTKQGIQRVAEGKWAATLTGLPKEEMTAALVILKDAIDGKLARPKGIDPLVGSKFPPIMTKDAIEKTGFKGEYDA